MIARIKKQDTKTSKLVAIGDNIWMNNCNEYSLPQQDGLLIAGVIR